MAIGVKAARVAKNLSQEKMIYELRKCGIKIGIVTYAKQEKNPDTMRIGTAKAISAITGIPIDDIFL